ASLVQKQRQRQQAQASRMRKGGKNYFAKNPLAQAAPHMALDLRARRLDQHVVVHAGRACCHARHATQAVVHVLPELPVQRRFSRGGFLNHVNAPARRIHFLAPQNISRADRQAKPAVDALVNVLSLRWMMLVKAGSTRLSLADGMRHNRQIFPTKRPGFRTRPESKRRLISRISGRASLCGPHTSTSLRIASGTRTAIALPPVFPRRVRRCSINRTATSCPELMPTVISPLAWHTTASSTPSASACFRNSEATEQTSPAITEAFNTSS